MTEVLELEPLTEPVDATVAIPGSKSITNRALIAAALAEGTSTLTGVLDADDTQAMLGAVAAVGAVVDFDGDTATIRGTGGQLASGPLTIDARLSGTTARFATPLAGRGVGPYTVDGAPEMRARPMGATADAMRSLGCSVSGNELPLVISGPMGGGVLRLAADVSSQFASGMLLAAPGLDDGLVVELGGTVVSRPYLDMTCAVMRAFGADVLQPTPNRFEVPAQSRYAAAAYAIEPDASAASYFFAAAAVSGGRIRIEGLTRDALQGDVGFVDVLAQMGAEVTWLDNAIEVRGTGELRGITVDMADISDTAQTLAAIAPFASSPTTVTGIDFIRNKETDRVAAVVAELNRLGIDAVEDADGFTITPGSPQPGVVQTYHDHRMAMSFALTGLMAPGVRIADPGCVAKTFPTFWQVLESLRR